MLKIRKSGKVNICSKGFLKMIILLANQVVCLYERMDCTQNTCLVEL